jgi:hypothetical protein
LAICLCVLNLYKIKTWAAKKIPSKYYLPCTKKDFWKSKNEKKALNAKYHNFLHNAK